MTATISGDGTSTLINLTTSGNTVLGDASTDTLNVGNGGLVKDASGNVGIGTASTNLSGAGNGKFLTILGAGATTTAASGRIELANPNTPATENECGSILFEQVGNNSNVRIATIAGTTTGSGGANGFGGYLTFYTKGDNVAGAPSERARIDSSGNLLVGTATASLTSGEGFKFFYNAGTNPYVGSVMSSSSNSQTNYHLYSTGAGAYRFYVGLGGTVYATITTITGISDQRLKENIRDLDDGLDKVMALQPRKFDWKEGKGADIKNARGFIAQEFETVFPDLIDEWKDPAPDGEEPYKSVRADLIPTLVKAIQEMKAIIDTQASTITQLQADVAALKAQP